eukprot:scaffold24419_cov196-Cylindrotheca_fusiformis.AAC.1
MPAYATLWMSSSKIKRPRKAAQNGLIVSMTKTWKAPNRFSASNQNKSPIIIPMIPDNTSQPTAGSVSLSFLSKPPFSEVARTNPKTNPQIKKIIDAKLHLNKFNEKALEFFQVVSHTKKPMAMQNGAAKAARTPVA